MRFGLRIDACFFIDSICFFFIVFCKIIKTDDQTGKPTAKIGATPSQPDEIVPGLFLGNVDAADDFAELRKRGVCGVIDLSNEPYTRSADIFYNRIRIEDKPTADIRSVFDETNSFIHSIRTAGKSVFVHCLAGVSRSGSVVVAYLVWSRGMSVDAALSYVRTRRPCVKPNAGFMKQLRAYEVELRRDK